MSELCSGAVLSGYTAGNMASGEHASGPFRLPLSGQILSGQGDEFLTLQSGPPVWPTSCVLRELRMICS